MDVSNFYTELFEDTLGLDILGMRSNYKLYVEVVNRKTLPTFSRYVPCHFYTYVDLAHYKSQMIYEDHNRVGREYYIDDPTLKKFNMFILGVDRVEVSSGAQFDPEASWYYSSVITSRQNISLDSILMGAESTYGRNIADFAIPFKKEHEYRGNNVLYLKNYPYQGQVEVTLSVNWPTLASVPEEFKDDLVKLAKLDIEIKEWPNLRYLENIPLPTGGNLDLKFDWSNAESERDEFINELRRKTLPDRVGPGYFKVV